MIEIDNAITKLEARLRDHDKDTRCADGDKCPQKLQMRETITHLSDARYALKLHHIHCVYTEDSNL
jgi:hypothetical protein